MEFDSNMKEDRCFVHRRLMVWVADEEQHDFQIHGFYQHHG
ncbi:hypothetical protein PVOR_01285 [Paenibacillus vortex V453]|uniref:Uncharacterized protein n=1 Tax=Paenibacillus vortex V453 TaxID=715225 RepID=A0A2R9T2N5_9BACL|nr:hypothetical protein PVOR_01285 [Paenibacillus vortex V453]